MHALYERTLFFTELHFYIVNGLSEHILFLIKDS